MQQVVQPRSSANGFGRRRVERDLGTGLENKSRSGKTMPGRLMNTSILSGSKAGGYGSPSSERLVYLTSCLIGDFVEVQVKDGSVFSGIFHATNAERDFGIILKMARLIKGGSNKGQKAVTDSPSKTLIIPAKEFVQIIGKDVSVTKDLLTDELQCVKQQDILLDSSISQSHHIEVGRELERWVPDEDDPQCPELEKVFDGPWNRGWDQFEANETLFGVKSTFNEELYTTKLERGPQMREMEIEASRIAGEIESEETQDLHLAEERGIHLPESFDIDEETRFSSVVRAVDDSGYDGNGDTLFDSQRIETFTVDSSVLGSSLTDLSGKSSSGDQFPSCSSSMDGIQPSPSSTDWELNQSGSSDHARQLSAELLSRNFSVLDGESRIPENQCSEKPARNNYTECVEKQMFAKEAPMSKSEDSHSSLREEKDSSEKRGLSPSATAYAPSPSCVPSSKGQEKMNSPNEVLEDAGALKTQGATIYYANLQGQRGSSASSASEFGGVASASSAPGSSPSSSLASLSLGKSTLNPHAKDFKLNPNAKSFTPSQTILRPTSPVSESSFYFPTSMAAVPHMHGMPLGIGVGPSFAGHQPAIFNPQAAAVQSPQAYFHPNGPQYGQQMFVGHPRQVLYMPTYPPEMPYKGRDF